MITTNLNTIFTNLKRAAIAAFAVLSIFTMTAMADDITLDMQGVGSATIPKGNTITRTINGIPAGIPGTLKLRLKWHAVNLIPNTFNALRVTLTHGTSTVIASTNCFSIHSNKTPKCTFDRDISQTEANRAGAWVLTVTNNSNDEVIGFDIAKNGDANPFVPNFSSVYTPDCPDTVNLDMEGTTLTLTKGSTQERRIFNIGSAAGVINLKIKWHAVAFLPTFNRLNIELFDSNGNRVDSASGNFFSMHAPSGNTPQYEMTINATAAQTSGPNPWKLRVTNNSNQEVIGFNIEKESGDVNPTVPSFRSTYRANCQ